MPKLLHKLCRRGADFEARHEFVPAIKEQVSQLKYALTGTGVELVVRCLKEKGRIMHWGYYSTYEEFNCLQHPVRDGNIVGKIG